MALAVATIVGGALVWLALTPDLDDDVYTVNMVPAHAICIYFGRPRPTTPHAIVQSRDRRRKTGHGHCV